MELFSVAGLSEFGRAGGFLFHLLADFGSEGWLIYCPSAVMVGFLLVGGF